ncbi:MAG: hypothetical protein HY835_08330 [Anaerolineae bacterium]|nr:hypothetical protein [Anaerolineae bacterium]
MKIRNRLNQAYQQAPWRKATQKGVFFLIVAILTASVLWVMLTVSVQAASAGLDVRAMDKTVEETQREIASLRTDIAVSTSSSRMETRAKELGFRPAGPDEVVYMVIPGYSGREPRISAPPPTVNNEPVLIKPVYTLSLSELLLKGLQNANSFSGGRLP